MTEISQRELRNDSGRVMRALDEGHSFVVTRNGAPIGELVPFRGTRFVSAKEVVAAFRGAPAVGLEALRRDLDAVVDPEVDLDG